MYQSADVILKALQSIDGKVDEIYCFDGRWEGYTGPDNSDDGTENLIAEFAKTSKSKVSFFKLPVLYQWQARTEALKHLENGDWAIMLDSDEMIVDWGEDVRQILSSPDTNAKVFRVCWTVYKSYRAIPTPRCVRKTETVHYSTDHRRLFDNEGEIDFLHAPVIHIVVDHQESSEKKKMRQQADRYKESLIGYEHSHWNPEDHPTIEEKIEQEVRKKNQSN
jgi:glycosyltransferase involved in cell wall biosynthesis